MSLTSSRNAGEKVEQLADGRGRNIVTGAVERDERHVNG